MVLINLTGHEVTIKKQDGRTMCLGPAAHPARLDSEQRQVAVIDGVEIVSNKFVPVNMPEPQEGVTYIVSTLIAMFLSERTDIVSPNALNSEQNVLGRTVLVNSLQTFCKRFEDNGNGG